MAKLFPSFGPRFLIPQADAGAPIWGCAERRHRRWLTYKRGERTALQQPPRPNIQSIHITGHCAETRRPQEKETDRKASKKQKQEAKHPRQVYPCCEVASKPSRSNHGPRSAGDVNSCRERNIPDCSAGPESWNACPRRQAHSAKVHHGRLVPADEEECHVRAARGKTCSFTQGTGQEQPGDEGRARPPLLEFRPSQPGGSSSLRGRNREGKSKEKL
ncbi:hypothetical protein QBC34DRAFT_69340 [Podospora aff. communis PSN243]|uniref:Uncharacterized protein n=1 Tax=Podospora aff. communis PSN243 TaxID=3040156 RepID=A0AAV9H4G2_9PEZI|nr:hypothetical protein QBC34DRAFT_69340 [Podospora aff. communis PSN243]